jgi:ribosomal protein S18 acetylase RimI-like enzyme
LAILHTERIPLESFGDLISTLIADLSIGRAQIVIEQIRRVAEAGHHDRLVILTTSESDSDSRPLAAVVAVMQAGLDGDSTNQFATIVHAGALQELGDLSRQSAIASLSAELDEQLHRQGIGFAQWATDPVKSNKTSADGLRHSSHDWCAGFGFQSIATLDYLCGPVLPEPSQPFGSTGPDDQNSISLRFSAFSWNGPTAFSELVDLVQQTYAETLDCRGLSEFRTTEQVLDGYRTADAFAPNLWFTLTDDHGNRVGCIILATHPAAPSAGVTDGECRVGSVEIVYMGLIPTARGNGWGTQLVQKAYDVAREVGADQVLLAVDQTNHPAKAIYKLAGLTPIVHETVWVKSLAGSVNASHTKD